MERLFRINERGSSVRTEIVGGIVTFFSMAYIIFVNPSYLYQTGMDFYAVTIATCLSAGIGSILTGVMSNMPFAQAPGMGFNTFFTFSICLGYGYSWQEALAIVFISGALLLTIMVTPLRTKILTAIPEFMRAAITAGIGLFIAFIGLINAGIVVGYGEGLGFYTELGAITQGAPLLALIGLILIFVLIAWNVKGAIFIGVIAATVIGIPFGLTVFEPMDISLGVISMTAGKLSFTGLMKYGMLPLVTSVISFMLVDMFDTAGAFLAMSASIPGSSNDKRTDRAMIADAASACIGALLGTSTVTTYIESTTGIQEGARTGLASIVVGLLFFLSCLFAPVAAIVPASATAPALIIVGIFMMEGAASIAWEDFEQAAPAFMTIAAMPFTYSISNGIGLGFISFTLIKVFRGKFSEVPVVIYVISVIYILSFILNGL